MSTHIGYDITSGMLYDIEKITKDMVKDLSINKLCNIVSRDQTDYIYTIMPHMDLIFSDKKLRKYFIMSKLGSDEVIPVNSEGASHEVIPEDMNNIIMQIYNTKILPFVSNQNLPLEDKFLITMKDWIKTKLVSLGYIIEEENKDVTDQELKLKRYTRSKKDKNRKRRTSTVEIMEEYDGVENPYVNTYGQKDTKLDTKEYSEWYY